jgi:hypothetical protein
MLLLVAALHHVMAVHFQLLSYFKRKNETPSSALEAEGLK